MRRPSAIQLATLLTAVTILFVGSSSPASAAKNCITIGEKSICFDDGRGKKDQDNNDDQDNNNGGGADDNGKQPKPTGDNNPKPKPKPTGNKCQGEIACPAGYVVLDKPNKYGACCEPREGLPAPKPPEEKCQFPGQIGTPPNCYCPEGTEFMGYKGCVQKEVEVGPAPKHIPRVMGCSTWDAENAAGGASEFHCNFGKTRCEQLKNGGARCCCICAAPGVDGCP